MVALKKSLGRNAHKAYDKWPASLLQTACSLRNIAGYSKCKKTDKMATVLEQLDRALGRSSPFFQDLGDKAAGD